MVDFVVVLFNPVNSRAEGTATEAMLKGFEDIWFSNGVNFHASCRKIPDVPAHAQVISLLLGKEAKPYSLYSSGNQIDPSKFHSLIQPLIRAASTVAQ
jgi:hypothetical protein